MPELPDVLLYVNALRRLLRGQSLQAVAVRSPSLLRTYDPPIDAIAGRTLMDVSRCGKRLVWHLERDLYLVFHLMIAGRFHWKKREVRPRSKSELAAFHFKTGTMMLTEASQQKRAGLWCIAGHEGVRALDAGGINFLDASDTALRAALLRSNNTLKRVLTDPSRFDGIGNAYSDEILHAAGLSPLQRSAQLTEQQMQRLIDAARGTLRTWIERLQSQTGERFPERVTAFRPEMAVHGKFGQACPVCAAPIQRIRYASSECNYCPGCQTGGRLLADRSLSRLLKDEWPKTLDDLEN